ncbi:MAG: hypothetical protein U1F43_18105 [Myxococcota bacterium]
MALSAPNSVDLAAAFLGALYAGLAVAPVHAGTPPVELARRGLARARRPAGAGARRRGRARSRAGGGAAGRR